MDWGGKFRGLATSFFFCIQKLAKNYTFTCSSIHAVDATINSERQVLGMAYVEYNPNPIAHRVGDCAVRAIAKALRVDWETAYIILSMNGFTMGDMPSSDSVWGATLSQRGFYRKSIPNTCPNCYTAEDFCRDHPEGTYVLGFGGHVATVHDGDLFDSWNSLNEIPQFYWTDEKES